MDFYQSIEQKIKQMKSESAFRFLKTENTPVLCDFSSNDYLGLGSDELLRQSFYQEMEKTTGLTASSSRLISGNHAAYPAMENYLSDLYGQRAALFFNSGFHLNVGVLPAISQKADLILADKLVHASLIEALKISSAKVIRYKHCDYEQLESLLKKHQGSYQNTFIVSESVFSMDGDLVDLEKIIALKEQYQALLYLDEAHAVGALGENGLGLAETLNLIPKVDFLAGTLGKALASVGAYLICHENVKQLLINRCRSLIYTTALPPINLAWSLFIMKQVQKAKAQRQQLKELSRYLSEQLKKLPLKSIGQSHIQAIVIGDNKQCLEMQHYFSEEGIAIQAIRPPTVPEGTARIRLSLHAKLNKKDIDIFIEKLREIEKD